MTPRDPASASTSSTGPAGAVPEPATGWQILALVVFLVLVTAAAALGGWFTSLSVDTWYPQLAKPAWNPPASAFGAVWSVLYLVMGVAAWLVWRAGGLSGARWALSAWAVQLVLNSTWSGLFFGLQRPAWALVEIGVLWLVIAVATALFFRRSRLAGWLMVPYLAWVTYAAALNAAIVQLN